VRPRVTQPPPSELSRRLRMYRLRRGFSQEQLAEFIGVTLQTISNWERGRMSRLGRKLVELLCLADSGDAVERAKEMRNAIDAMELAMMGWPELVDLPEKWGEPRHRSELAVSVPGTAGQVYRICDALEELTRIINSDEYHIGACGGTDK
jgi:transcriptional regulator with XRE-family HTH domain